jgi:hypothetical protein
LALRYAFAREGLEHFLAFRGLDPYKDKEGDVKAFFESEARTLREEARKLGSQWMDLVEDELRDDERAGIER